MKWIYLISRVWFAWTFFNFLACYFFCGSTGFKPQLCNFTKFLLVVQKLSFFFNFQNNNKNFVKLHKIWKFSATRYCILKKGSLIPGGPILRVLIRAQRKNLKNSNSLPGKWNIWRVFSKRRNSSMCLTSKIYKNQGTIQKTKFKSGLKIVGVLKFNKLSLTNHHQGLLVIM